MQVSSFVITVPLSCVIAKTFLASPHPVQQFGLLVIMEAHTVPKHQSCYLKICTYHDCS